MSRLGIDDMISLIRAHRSKSSPSALGPRPAPQVPEEEIGQKSVRMRRTYRLDVQPFRRRLHGSIDELRQVGPRPKPLCPYPPAAKPALKYGKFPTTLDRSSEVVSDAQQRAVWSF